jgi:hypothetical protein
VRHFRGREVSEAHLGLEDGEILLRLDQIKHEAVRARKDEAEEESEAVLCKESGGDVSDQLVGEHAAMRSRLTR